MRKVKLLALLLAALMVVAAFAGCADTAEIEGEVDGLESRVEALESAIGNVQGSVGNLESSVSGIGSSINENNTTIQGVLDALKELESKLNDTEDTQAPVTQPPVVEGDSVDALKKKADELGALIGGLQAEVMANQAHYVSADYVAALQAMTAAHTEIAASNTVAAMDAVYVALQAKLDTFVRVDEKFYNYYTELKGNYTGDEACVAKVEEALDWYKDAELHYAETTVKEWTKYQTGVDENGKPVYVDLVKYHDDMEDWEADLEDVKDEAERLVELIEDIERDTPYADLRNNIGTPYKAWAKAATELSPVHLALVSNYDKYESALLASEVYDDAEKDLKLLKVDALLDTQITDVNGQVGLFDNYFLLKGDNNKHLVYAYSYVEDGETVVVETVDIYDEIIDEIEAWATEYGLDDETVAFMVNKNFSGSVTDEYFYATFLKGKAFVEDMAAKSVEFKDTLAKNIKALNNKRMSNVNETFVSSYEANTKAINDWYKASFEAYKAAYNAEFEADRAYASNTLLIPVTDAAYKTVFAANFDKMVADAKLGKYCEDHEQYYYGSAHDSKNCGTAVYTSGLDATGANVNFTLLYDFDDELVTFLTKTYAMAKAAAELINNNVANYKVDNKVDLSNYVTVIGGYLAPKQEAGTDFEGKPVVYNFLRVQDDAYFETDALVLDLLNAQGEPYAEGEAKDGVADTGDGIPDFIAFTDNNSNGYYDDGDVLKVESIAAYMALFGKNGALTGKADLSALVDEDAYDAVLEALKARLVAIDDATAALSTAYDAVFGEKDEVIVTTADSAKVAALVAAANAWKKAGGRTDAKLATVVATVDGHEEYEIVNIVDSYEVLKDKASSFEANIKKLETRIAALNAEAKMLESLYKVLDTVNAATPITLEKLADATTNVAVTKISQTAKDEDGKFKWNISYVYFDKDEGIFNVRSTQGCDNKNETDAWAAITAGSVRAIYNSGTDLKTLNKKVTELADLFHGSNKSGATNAYMFNVTDLIDLATNLYAKFMVNNYGVKVDSIETARKNFAAENSGYEFTAWVNSVINHLQNDQAFDKDAMMSVDNLTEMAYVLNAAAKTTSAVITEYPNGVAFGGYTVADMQAANDEFTLKSASFTDNEKLLEHLGMDEEKVETVSGVVVVEDIDVAPTTVWTPDVVA